MANKTVKKHILETPEGRKYGVVYFRKEEVNGKEIVSVGASAFPPDSKKRFNIRTGIRKAKHRANVGMFLYKQGLKYDTCNMQTLIDIEAAKITLEECVELAQVFEKDGEGFLSV